MLWGCPYDSTQPPVQLHMGHTPCSCCVMLLLQSGRSDGTVYVFDDFREAYAWMRHNTHPEAKVASW